MLSSAVVLSLLKRRNEIIIHVQKFLNDVVDWEKIVVVIKYVANNIKNNEDEAAQEARSRKDTYTGLQKNQLLYY
jgi:hypothetical protein